MGRKGSSFVSRGVDSVKALLKLKNKVAPETYVFKDREVTDLEKTQDRIPVPRESFSAYENEKPVKDCPLLQLPTRERVLIWRQLGPKSVLDLRRTCSRIKSDIDHFVGVFGKVDDRDPKNLAFFGQVGLQGLRIINLTGIPEEEIVRFLLHPLLLKYLRISGDISSAYFAYITEYCPFITAIRILMNNHTINNRIHFFPIMSQHWATERTFEYLKDVCLVVITKKNADLTYVADAVLSLLKDDLSGAVGMRRLQFTILHKAYAPQHMRALHETIAAFANSNADTLTHFVLEMKDTQMEDANEATNDFQGRVLRRGSAEWTEIKDSFDLETVQESTEATMPPELDKKPQKTTTMKVQLWNPFPNLKRIYLSVNGEYCEYWKRAFVQTSTLTHLFLEMNMTDNWAVYCSFIEPSAPTLKNIDCYEITQDHEGSNPPGVHTAIDARVVAKCKSLTRLSLNFCNDENGIRYRLLNLGTLPKYILFLQFAWIVLDPCELFKLALCHRRLLNLNMSYWSISDERFIKFWCLFQWIFALHLTNLKRLVVTDSKIRFQTGQEAVTKFIQRHKMFTEYFSAGETCLVFDRKPKKLPLAQPSELVTTSYDSI